MKLLNKYHKQSLDKGLVKQLESVNQTLKLKLNIKSPLDCLKLSVYETGLKNKSFFESKFELIRQNNIDLWSNLSFVERNFIIKCDIATDKVKRLSFKHEDTTITIPFFDVLMNGLYDKETAILELPQFFKLYKDFHSKMISLETYGLKPYIANMSFARFIASQGSCVVMYHDDSATFYKLENNAVTTYPVLMGKHDDAMIRFAGKELLENDDAFVDALISQEMIAPKCIQKIEKYRSKGKAI